MELPPHSGSLKAKQRGLAQQDGQAAENAARDFLQAQGFHLVSANYHCRQGEIDLIMQQPSLLVFAEVRFRSRPDFGGAAASVTTRKQQKIIASAGAFLHHHPEFASYNCRFDVLALQKTAGQWHVEWLPAAFTT
ncbi:MAG: YraN family protein [bacterium]|nr:YraN family protein [bacterium]